MKKNCYKCKNCIKFLVFFNYLRKLLELNSSSFPDFSDEETISGDASLQVLDTSPERH